ncbi:barstar family protein [Kribbella sp. NPDC003505]|uniref:barstar family protein n=1 Tax=Kribbella sp. NPDC003505 TaxID=3154448 RepID=UPI0033AC6CD0
MSAAERLEMSRGNSTVPLYHLVEEGSGRVIVAAQEIDGFFVGSNDAVPEDVIIFGVARESVHIGKDLSDMELRVVNSAGEAIGSYYIGRVMLRSAFEVRDVGGSSGFVASFYGLTCPYPTAGSIWRRWASGVPISKGEWAEYPMESHGDWLHVVQNSWFETGHAAKKYGATEIAVIDGREIFGESSFYCALGESINGPGGYFGSNLDALAECLAFSRGEGAPFELVWQYSLDAQKRMGAALVESVLDVMSEFGVGVAIR